MGSLENWILDLKMNLHKIFCSIAIESSSLPPTNMLKHIAKIVFVSIVFYTNTADSFSANSRFCKNRVFINPSAKQNTYLHASLHDGIIPDTASQGRRDIINQFFSTSTALIPFILFPNISNGAENEKEDLLSDFGRSLSTENNSNYPYTPSPLPTSSSSALDLTNISTSYEKEKQQPQQQPLTIDEQIQKMSKEKRIAPRTHG